MRFLAVLIPALLVIAVIAMRDDEPLRVPAPVPRLIPHEAAWFLVMRIAGEDRSLRMWPVKMPDYSHCLRSIDHAAVQRSRGALSVRCEDRGL